MYIGSRFSLPSPPQVSLEKEIKSNPPRTYSLQKLVEVAYENMSRIRLVWSRIWAHIGEHFTQVGCSLDKKVSFFLCFFVFERKYFIFVLTN